MVLQTHKLAAKRTTWKLAKLDRGPVFPRIRVEFFEKWACFTASLQMIDTV